MSLKYEPSSDPLCISAKQLTPNPNALTFKGLQAAMVRTALSRDHVWLSSTSSEGST